MEKMKEGYEQWDSADMSLENKHPKYQVRKMLQAEDYEARLEFANGNASADATLALSMENWLLRRIAFKESALASLINQLDNPQDIRRLISLAAVDWKDGRILSQSYHI